MFCTEERVLSANKMREIKIGPVPISNVSCFNDNVWEAIGRPGLEAVIKTSILAILAMATVLANLIFILVLRSNKFRRHAHVQVWFFCLFVSLFDLEFGIVLPSCIPIGIGTIHILLCKHIYITPLPPTSAYVFMNGPIWRVA